HPVEQSSRLVPQPFRVGLDAAQLRLAKAAEHIIVIDPDNRNFLRDLYIVLAAGVENLLGPDVIAGEQRQRAGLLPKPSGNRNLGAQAALLNRLNVTVAA